MPRERAAEVAPPCTRICDRSERRLDPECAVEVASRIGDDLERQIALAGPHGRLARVEDGDLAQPGSHDLVDPARHLAEVQGADRAAGEAPELQVDAPPIWRRDADRRP